MNIASWLETDIRNHSVLAWNQAAGVREVPAQGGGRALRGGAAPLDSALSPLWRVSGGVGGLKPALRAEAAVVAG